MLNVLNGIQKFVFAGGKLGSTLHEQVVIVLLLIFVCVMGYFSCFAYNKLFKYDVYLMSQLH